MDRNRSFAQHYRYIALDVVDLGQHRGPPHRLARAGALLVPAEDGKMQVVVSNPRRPAPKGAQRAITRWTLVSRHGNRALVSLEPETGRTHQLRVQLAAMGTPIEGDTLYGDLVVGRYDTGKQAVQWETVDGVPAREAGTCPDHDRTGWRKGETESGDDVGLWTSIQVGSDGAPRVVYYDATHKSLKYATKRGDAWTSYVLKAPPTPAGDYGRYAKMILVDDKPVVAFLAMEPGTAGKALSHVVVARASSASPADGGARSRVRCPAARPAAGRRWRGAARPT